MCDLTIVSKLPKELCTTELTAKDDKDSVGDHEEEAHLRLKHTTITTSAKFGEGVGNVASDKRPRKRRSAEAWKD